MLLTPITEIFCDIDDFCKQFLKKQSLHLLENPERIRDKPCQMSLSEIATIVVLFQMGHYRNFKHFYLQCVKSDLKALFPKALSYSRFIECQSSALSLLTAYLLSKAGKHTGLYYIDSTTLKVCHN